MGLLKGTLKDVFKLLYIPVHGFQRFAEYQLKSESGHYRICKDPSDTLHGPLKIYDGPFWCANGASNGPSRIRIGSFNALH